MSRAMLILLVFSIFPLNAQDSGSGDAAEVQNILDRCGMKGVTIQDVAVVENGRVVSLDLKNRDISKDGISFIPPEIGKLSALRVLNMSGNIIDSIPFELGSLINLQKLDLSSNRIVVVPPVIGKLFSLTNLDLRHNRITELPPEIDQCKALAVVQLWGNKLSSLNDAVTRLPALEELYLNDNRLTSLPAGIIKMRLRYIDFSGNKLCSLDGALSAWAKKKDPHFNETQKCW